MSLESFSRVFRALSPNRTLALLEHLRDMVGRQQSSVRILAQAQAKFAHIKMLMTVVIAAATGISYVFVRNVTSNLREKDDAYGSALGGFVAGSIVGIKGRTVASVLGMGAFTAVLTGVMTHTGGSLKGGHQDLDADVKGQKDAHRKNYRSPIEQTIAELGEGRGIHGPGYAERRKERIKANYGIEVP